MRYRLRTLLILLAAAPPLLPAAWSALRSLVHVVYYSRLSDWQPLLTEAGSIAGLAAVVTIAIAICQRTVTAR